MEQPQNKGSTRHTLEYCLEHKKVGIYCNTKEEWDKVAALIPKRRLWDNEWRIYADKIPTITIDKYGGSYGHKKWYEDHDYVVISAQQFLADNGQQVDSIQIGDWVEVLDTPEVRKWSCGKIAIGYKFSVDRIQGSEGKLVYLDKENKYSINYLAADLRKLLPHEIPQTGTEQWKVGDRVERLSGYGNGFSQDIPIGTKGTVNNTNVNNSRYNLIGIKWDTGEDYNCMVENLKKLQSGTQTGQDTGSVVEEKWKVGSQFTCDATPQWIYTIESLDRNNKVWIVWNSGNDRTSYSKEEANKHWGNVWKPYQPANIPVTADNACIGMRVVGIAEIAINRTKGNEVGTIVGWYANGEGVKVKWDNESYSGNYTWGHLLIAPSNKTIKQSNNNNQSQIKTNNNATYKENNNSNTDSQYTGNSNYQACKYQLRTNPKGAQGHWESGGEATAAVYKVKPKISQALYRED